MTNIRQRNGRFQAQVRIKSNGRIVFSESATFDTRKQAEVWKNALEAKVDREGIVARQAQTTTLKDLMDLHEKLLIKAGKQVRGSIHVLNTFRTDPIMSTLPLADIKTSDIAGWAMRYAVGRAPGSVLHALMTLRSAYRTAITMHDIQLDLDVVINATKQMTRLGVAAKSQERDRRVSDDEIDRIATYQESLYGATIPLRSICTLAVLLPRRREELMTMRWKDYTGQQIKLFDTKDPNKVRDEVVPVPDAAAALIDALPRTDERILPYNPSSVGDAFIRIATILGIDDLHFHDLRHEGISRLFAAGLNIPEVSLISGHTSWATLKRYTHLKPSDVLEKLRAGPQTK